MSNAAQRDHETAFRAVLDEHLGAVRNRHVIRFAATLGEDAMVVDGSGRIVRGTDAVLRSHAEWFALEDEWTFDYEVMETRVSARSGIAVLRVAYRHGDGKPVRFLLSLVFERGDDGAYRFVYDQNTPLT